MRTPNIDDFVSWYRIAKAECSRNEIRGTRLSAFPKGLHRVVDNVQLCEAGKVEDEIAHLNSKLERSGPEMLVSAPGRRGRLV